MAKKVKPEEPAKAESQKVADTFAPINATDRPATRRNFYVPKSFRPRRFGAKKLGLSIGFVVLIMIAGTVIFKVVSSGEDSATNEVKSVFSNDEMKDYRSPENNFTIKMPGFPSIKSNKIAVGNEQIPQTIYERSISGDKQLYLFEILDFTKSPIKDAKNELEAKLNARVQNLPGAELTSSKAGSYSGNVALEASYKYKENSKDFEGRVRYIVKDNKVYVATLVGGDQAKFDEFANSLRFL